MDAIIKPRPTDEQSAIVNRVLTTNDNIIIWSLAGTGKTSTLEMIQAEIKVKPILYIVFNKKNADEALEKFPSTTTVVTINGLGHRIWMKTIPHGIKLDPKKSGTILKDIINAAPRNAQGPIWDVYWDVIQAVALAKSLGYVPEGRYPMAKRLITRESFHASLEETPDELVADLIDAVLFTSIKQSYDGYIDFNDQIYMPGLFGGAFPRYPLVKVDEAQDLNAINHEMLTQLGRNRLIAVGDPWQSIYQFRGAVQGGMEKIKSRFGMTKMELSISFRCPEAVVAAARWRVPQLKAFKPGGEYAVLNNLHIRDIPDGAAIICRNNAPLFKLALRLLSARRSVSVAGSDIGPKIIATMKKLGDGDMDQESLLLRIEDWRAEKVSKNSTTAADTAECMRVFASFGKTLAQAIGTAEHMFKQHGAIRLLTGHKSKGLEWDTVYHLDPWLIGDDEQEQNLRYVITTRSLNRLFEVNSAQIK